MIRRLTASDWCDVVILDLIPQQFGQSYNLTEAMLHETRPDLILITGDRVEMCAAAAAAFHNKVKIAHLYAGCINAPITTFDDIDRDVISLWSDIFLVENLDAGYRVADLTGRYVPSLSFNPERELKEKGIHIVGITHLDDLEIDESKVPAEPYDLLLINSEPLAETPKWEKERFTIQIGGNPDGDIARYGNEFYQSLPRSQFLGLLKNCRCFITNSSVAIYEAPFFIRPEQIVMVGKRNLNRASVECKPGGSNRVVEVLRQYALDRARD